MRYLAVGIITFVFWLGISGWWYSCRIKGTCNDQENTQTDTDSTRFNENKEALSLFDPATGRIYPPEGSLLFEEGTLVSADSPGFELLVDEIREILDENPDQMLKIEIQGKFEQGEEQIGDALREALEAAGLPAEKLTVGYETLSEGQEIDPDAHSDNVLKVILRLIADPELADNPPENPIETPITDNPPENNQSEAPIADMSGVHRIYFSFAKPILASGNRDKKFIREGVAYLRKYPRKKAYITGFTDDTAAMQANKKLGMKRAEVIRDLFLKEGANRVQLVLNSKGEANPIASNNSPSGRAKNRRVEITFGD